MADLIPVEPDYDPAMNYPAKGAAESCLIIALNCELFTVLAHTGRFFHAQINCAGYGGEDIGIVDVPDEPGYFVFENGVTHVDADNVEIEGDWREATVADFIAFDYPLPACAKPEKLNG